MNAPLESKPSATTLDGIHPLIVALIPELVPLGEDRTADLAVSETGRQMVAQCLESVFGAPALFDQAAAELGSFALYLRSERASPAAADWIDGCVSRMSTARRDHEEQARGQVGTRFKSFTARTRNEPEVPSDAPTISAKDLLRGSTRG